MTWSFIVRTILVLSNSTVPLNLGTNCFFVGSEARQELVRNRRLKKSSCLEAWMELDRKGDTRRVVNSRLWTEGQ